MKKKELATTWRTSSCTPTVYARNNMLLLDTTILWVCCLPSDNQEVHKQATALLKDGAWQKLKVTIVASILLSAEQGFPDCKCLLQQTQQLDTMLFEMLFEMHRLQLTARISQTLSSTDFAAKQGP